MNPVSLIAEFFQENPKMTQSLIDLVTFEQTRHSIHKKNRPCYHSERGQCDDCFSGDTEYEHEEEVKKFFKSMFKAMAKSFPIVEREEDEDDEDGDEDDEDEKIFTEDDENPEPEEDDENPEEAEPKKKTFDQMNVSDFISSLTEHKYKTISSETAKQILKQLENDKEYLFTVDNFDQFIPNWRDMKTIQIGFTYQYRISVLDVDVYCFDKAGNKHYFDDLNDNCIYDTEFAERMQSMITHNSLYRDKFVLDCFDQDLLKQMKENGVGLKLTGCDRGSDS